jgi:hypothetical protein
VSGARAAATAAPAAQTTSSIVGTCERYEILRVELLARIHDMHTRVIVTRARAAWTMWAADYRIVDDLDCWRAAIVVNEVAGGIEVTLDRLPDKLFCVARCDKHEQQLPMT